MTTERPCVEPSIRWRKEQLHWTLPRFQDAETWDRWSMVVSLAQWMVYLARPLVGDHPLPWQKGQRKPKVELCGQYSNLLRPDIVPRLRQLLAKR